MKTLTIGYCTTDLVLQVKHFAADDEEVVVQRLAEYAGGSAANVAVGLRRLGLESAFLGSLSRDERGLANVAVLEHEKVDTSRVIYSTNQTSSPFVVAVVDPTGSRRLYFHGGSGQELRPETLNLEALAGVGCVHVCTLEPGFLERILRLREELPGKLLVSADPGCVGLEGNRVKTVRALMPELDVLFVNEVEFSRLFPGLIPAQIATLGREALPRQLVIKRGPLGVYVFNADDGLCHQPAFPVQTIDTTGAGDAFAAGYLGGLWLGFSTPRLAAFACAVAALSSTRIGCRDGLPSRDQVETFLASFGDDGEIVTPTT